MPSVEREAGHAAAAEALVRLDAPPDAIALHLLLIAPAGQPWAVATLRAAARRALALGDPEAATRFLQRALDERGGADEAPIFLELGLAQGRAGDPAALDSLERAVDTAVDPETRAGAHLQLARCLNRLGRSGDAADVLERGIAALGNDPALEAELVSTAYVRSSSRRRLATLVDSFREPDSAPSTPLELARTAAAAIEYAIARGDPARGAELARLALSSPAVSIDASVTAQAAVLVVLALTAAEQYEQAEALTTAHLTRARSEGSLLGAAIASGGRAALRLRRDDLLGAEADALACLDVVAGQPGAEAIAMGAAASVVRAGIELGRAHADLERVLEENRGDPDYFTYGFHHLAEGLLRSAAGEFERALTCFEECGEQEWGIRCPSLYPWRSAAAVTLARLGHADEARERAHEELELVRTTPTPRALGISLQAAAAVATSDDERLPFVEEAVLLVDGSQQPLELARALVGRGALLRRTGQRTRAREDLQRAYDLASARGAVRVAEAAAEELRSSGARLRRATGAGADSLTPSERRVAELAAAGLSNRDIAQSLFLSEKTVEAHLGRTYRKLGIRNRTRLAAALS